MQKFDPRRVDLNVYKTFFLLYIFFSLPIHFPFSFYFSLTPEQTKSSYLRTVTICRPKFAPCYILEIDQLETFTSKSLWQKKLTDDVTFQILLASANMQNVSKIHIGHVTNVMTLSTSSVRRYPWCKFQVQAMCRSCVFQVDSLLGV